MLHVCSVSGNLPEKFFSPMNRKNPKFRRLVNELKAAIAFAANEGYSTFLCGMSEGFDLIAASVLLDLQKDPLYHHIQLVGVLPYKDYSVSADWQTLYSKVMQNLTSIHIFSQSYYSNCCYQRNNWMVQQSGRLICYWDGQDGSTAQTVNMAWKKGIQVINLATLPNKNIPPHSLSLCE